MPWRVDDAMSQRVRFVGECLAGDATMTELCERFGVSRKTGYKWLGRYGVEGPAGLVDRPRAPLRQWWARTASDTQRSTRVRRAEQTHSP